jgi:hypothetical protein
MKDVTCRVSLQPHPKHARSLWLQHSLSLDSQASALTPTLLHRRMHVCMDPYHDRFPIHPSPDWSQSLTSIILYNVLPILTVGRLHSAVTLPAIHNVPDSCSIIPYPAIILPTNEQHAQHPTTKHVSCQTGRHEASKDEGFLRCLFSCKGTLLPLLQVR